MKKKFFVAVFAIMSLSGAFAMARAAGQGNTPVEQRIKKVENGLIEFNPGAPAVAGKVPKLLTLAERMAFYKVPGVTIAVIDHERIEWVKSPGMLKAGQAAVVTPGSFFEAASTTKAVIAAIVLSLVEEGKLDLDADVNTYLKSWQVAENDFTRRQKVTLRLLLTHRAGLPRTNFPYDEKQAPPTLLQVLKGEAPAGNKAAIVELLPGSQWQYSNIGYVVIQQLLEDVLGRPLEQLRPRRGARPLAMSSSTFTYPLDAERQKHEALPHDEQGASGTPAMHPVALAQGGLMTTPSDLARFACDLLQAYNGRARSLLSPAMVRRMLNKEDEPRPSPVRVSRVRGAGRFCRGQRQGALLFTPRPELPGRDQLAHCLSRTGPGRGHHDQRRQGRHADPGDHRGPVRVYGWPLTQ